MDIFWLILLNECYFCREQSEVVDMSAVVDKRALEIIMVEVRMLGMNSRGENRREMSSRMKGYTEQ